MSSIQDSISKIVSRITALERAQRGTARLEVSSGFARGTSFPTSPTNGALVYRTDLVELFYYDANRSKWLSVATFSDGGGYSGAVPASPTYMRRYNGVSMSATIGTAVPFLATIVGFSWTMAAGVSGDWVIRGDGVALATIATAGAAKGATFSLNANIASGSVLALQWATSIAITNPQLAVYFRRRAT